MPTPIKPATKTEALFLKVEAGKLDLLMNLIGELVTQKKVMRRFATAHGTMSNWKKPFQVYSN
ncbi:hypothetical protein [Alishewanella longhuensis]